MQARRSKIEKKKKEEQKEKKKKRKSKKKKKTSNWDVCVRVWATNLNELNYFRISKKIPGSFMYLHAVRGLDDRNNIISGLSQKKKKNIISGWFTL